MAEMERVAQAVSEEIFKVTDTCDDRYDFIRETSEDIMSALINRNRGVITEYRNWLIAHGYGELSDRLYVCSM